MIKITRVAKKKAVEFNESEWDRVNEIHFGKGVRWNTTPFRFKATENGKIVGLIFGKHESGTVYVHNIIVAAKKRRRGIGTKLMEKAEDFGRKFGDHKIWLITGEDYPEDSFFIKLGFKREAFLPDLYFKRDFIVYTKRISQTEKA
ncbi:GNAT family N-acetyltransferase [Patescibacteria group bacterium]